MAFWNSTALEPNRSFRWKITFADEKNNIQGLTYFLKKCNKPSMKLSKTEHWFLNHKFNFPGRVTWEPINISFVSVPKVEGMQTGTSQALYKYFKDNGYMTPNEAASNGGIYTSISKKNAVNALAGSGMKLSQIDAEGKDVETWELKNGFFTDVKFGELDYEQENIVEVSCTIEYDWATLV